MNRGSIHRRRRIAITAALFGAVACTARRPPAVAPPDDSPARLAVEQGCYECLLRAREVYTQLSATHATPDFRLSLLEVDLLIALRQREMGLDADSALTRARTLAAAVLPDSQARRLFALVDAVPPDPDATPASARGAWRRAHVAHARTIPAEVAWLNETGLSATFRTYLSLAASCTYRGGQRPRTPATPSELLDPELPPDGPPILGYRAALCAPLDAPALRQVRLIVPTFVETSYFLAKSAVASAGETGGGEAPALLAEARGRFPNAPGVNFVSGQVAQALGQCGDALGHFDATLALQPAHDGALLGRTVCLTGVKRRDDALVAATAVIERAPSIAALGYYWRAVNRHATQSLDSARADIERAKEQDRWNLEILTLSGVIEHDQLDLAPAEADLRAAIRMPGGEDACTAVLYLALVMGKATRWSESIDQYTRAMNCYDRRIGATRAKITAVQQHPEATPEFKAYRIAQLEQLIAESRTGYHAAAFNGATDNARLGRFAPARELLDIAAGDPKLADAVARLRAVIER